MIQIEKKKLSTGTRKLMNLICTLLTLSFESWTYSAMQDGRMFIGEKPTSLPQDSQNTSGKMCKMCKSVFPQLNSLKPT